MEALCFIVTCVILIVLSFGKKCLQSLVITKRGHSKVTLPSHLKTDIIKIGWTNRDKTYVLQHWCRSSSITVWLHWHYRAAGSRAVFKAWLLMEHCQLSLRLIPWHSCNNLFVRTVQLVGQQIFQNLKGSLMCKSRWDKELINWCKNIAYWPI